jgi:hypothetical protein
MTADQRLIPPPPTGCGDDHLWERTDEVSHLSDASRLLWDACQKCGRHRFIIDPHSRSEKQDKRITTV